MTPSPPILNLGLRELPSEDEACDVKYLVRLSSDFGRVKPEFMGDCKLSAASQVHPSMLRHTVTGETLGDLRLKVNSPWRFHTSGQVTIQDNRPLSHDIAPLSIAAEGDEDEREFVTGIPPRILENMQLYHLPGTSADLH